MYDNTVSARTYLSYIAEQAGGRAVIGRDGKLYIKTIGESSVTLPLKLFKTFKWGEKFKITRVRYDDGIQLFEKGDTTGNTVYISQDNMYIVDQDQINNIYNALKGLEFYSFKGESIIDPALDTGDIVVIDGKNVIYQGSMQFSGRWIANIESKIQCKAKEETTTRTPSQRTINRRVESNINQIDGKITQLTEETTENTQKLTKVEQDVNGITSKVSSVETQVNNITNTQASISGKNIHIEDSAEEPFVDIKIKGETIQKTRSGRNIFNKNAKAVNNGASKSVLDTGVRISQSSAGNFRYSSIKLGSSELLGKILRISVNMTKSADNTPFIAIYFGNSGNTAISMIGGLTTSSTNKKMTIPNAFPTVNEKVCDTVYILLYSNINGTGNAGDYVDYTDLIVTIDNEDMSYEDYGVSPSPDYPSKIENIEGNVEIKDVWENLVNPNNVTEGYISDNSGQLLGINVNNKSTGYIEIDGEEKYYILSNKGTGNWGAWYDKDKKFISGIALGISSNGIITAPSNAYFMRFTLSYNNNNPNYANNVMIARSDKAIPYTPHKEQKVIFPLSEGQKLYKASYLASNGMHHNRAQTTVNISNIVTLSNGNIGGIFHPAGKKYSRHNGLCCDKAKYDPNVSSITGTIYENPANVVFVGNSTDTLETLKAKYDGAILEYELAEEEIVPYIETQQEAWNKIEQLHTYKNVTNIFSDAELDIVYVRDNGLSDMYETKQNANKEYKKTTQKLAEHEVTADSIKASVEETKESINALDGTVKEQSKSITSLNVSAGKINANITDLKENTEQSINEIKATSEGLSIAITNVGGNNLIRNSAMINDNNFWLAHAKYPYIESSFPPDPVDGMYWYCTENNGAHQANQMYLYTNNEWQESAISKKALLSTQNYMANTTSNEYWADGTSANESTLSGRVIKLNGKEDYTVSHIYNITEPIILNKNEDKTAISYFVKNNIIQGSVGIGLMFLDFTDLTTIEKPYSIYEPGILLTPDDLKDLTKIESIINIPKKSDFIPVVVSNTAPTDITKTWLDASIYLPKVYNADTSQWELLDTRMSLYNEETREIWTYRYFYGFYYQTPVNYDSLEIKSCYVALTYYPAFAVYTGNVEPTPHKGLYWNNKTTNLVKRAKYNNTNFVEWETLDIPSSMLPSGASLGVPMFDYIVPIKGFFEIADLKLEYNAICTKWTQFPGEVYSKNYKMDEKGFWIQSQQNTMYIDEDEILATYKGINIFQINKDLAYFYKVKAKESVQIGDYFLKEQQINNKNMLLFY